MKSRLRLFLIFAALLLVVYFLDQWRRARIEFSQDRNIISAAQEHGVDPALIKAVVWRESRFRPGARGGKGEIGLMQIMPATAKDWAGAQKITLFSDRMLFEPIKNIQCGTWYLRKLLARYRNTDDPVPYALADYNAGRANVLKWTKGSAATNSAAFIEQIGFPSTREYVRAVLKRRAKYRRQFPATDGVRQACTGFSLCHGVDCS